jgi:DNA-binding MarR family transcriptional regulator
MRPAHIYANLTPAQHDDLITALHGHWRVAARIVMILLSASGMSAPEIAELLHYDPVTVRRWIDRHEQQDQQARRRAFRTRALQLPAALR